MFIGKFIFCIFLFITSLLSQQQSVHQIIAVNNSYAYAATQDKLFVFDAGSQKWHEISFFAKNFTQKKSRQDFVRASCCDIQGNLWVLLPNKIAVYFRERNVWENIEIQSISPSFFAKVDMVYWNKSIWIATPEELLGYNTQSKKWTSIAYPIGINGGTIRIGLDKRLWLSGRVSFDGQSWQKLPPIPNMWQEKQNESFAIDTQGRPWVITDAHVYFFDFLHKKWELAIPSLIMTRLTSITCFQNEMWICDYGKGVFKFVDNKWSKITLDQPRPSLDYGHKFFVTDDYLWVNTYFGVGSYDGQKWRSHFDYTQYDSVNRLFYTTLATIIILLLVWIISIFVVNRYNKSS